jgi:DNA (cytosine-5)-methyltransferase 1
MPPMILGIYPLSRPSPPHSNQETDQLEIPLRSSPSDFFYDDPSQLSPNSNRTTYTSSEGENRDDRDTSPTSSPRQPGLSRRSRTYQPTEGLSTSGSDSDHDIDTPRGFDDDVTSNDQFRLTNPTKLRGSFQQGHSQPALQPSQLTIPKSRYDGYVPPLPICKESVAVQELLGDLKRQKLADPSSGANNRRDDADFEELELSNFAVYLPPNSKWHAYEMRGLQHLATKCGHGSFYFDGILSTGTTRRYVQGIPFKICSIGNYGEDIHEVGSNIWIQSDLNSKSKSEIYYRLATPSFEYERFHDGFLWLADLAKHFVDFSQTCGHSLSIENFRSNFYDWLKVTHQASSTFDNWYQKYGNEDFRRAIVANVNFLYKESIGVDEDLRSQPIWREIMERDAIPNQPIRETMTVVTPYVYECFKDIRFGHQLLPVEPSSVSEIRQTLQGKALDLTVNSLPTRQNLAVDIPDVTQQLCALPKKIKKIKIGDVLSVTKDGPGSVWKDEVSRWKAADDCWYVYVQGIHESKDGQRSFESIWLYKPSDTSCAKMKYPYPNELFLSDNCTCSRSRIMEDEILDVVSVLWHVHPSEAGEKLFVRQTYLENERFVTLKDAHKKCEHLQVQENSVTSITPSKYPIGQTVLVAPRQKSRHELEPYEIIEYVSEGSKLFAVLRRLQRRREIDGNGRPNELVYTEKREKFLASKIQRTCLIRFYSESDIERRRIPAPYNRDGTGNAFYIATRLIQDNEVSKLSHIEGKPPQTLIQGFDPSAAPSRQVLRGMDLYCGGGSFGRGLEEGGAVHNEWAVDINKNAIHTYAANLNDPRLTKLFYGSVDDLLKQALQGNPNDSELIPLPGDVEFISAGSPCQGFSQLNAARNNEKGLKNQSLVASVAAYVDLYRPKYGILENVMAMARKGHGRDEDVLSQLICAIVGMGYQVQLFVLDAWSCGSPQSRSRLFVSFAAPGLEPLEHPQLSHSHPPKATGRGLGTLANGESFGRRIQGPTPFEYVTAGEATKDLPRIGDGCTYQCTKQPDHVPGRGISTTLRNQIRAIPVYPRGMNFSKAWNEGRGVMTQEERDLFPLYTKEGMPRENTKNGSTAWGRVNPKGLFPTIVVGLYASDSRVGCNLHWDDHRYLSTMEARRAQSFPDEEVLLGTPAEGWKLMGNSVARSVALALGLSLRDAWFKNEPDYEQAPMKTNTSLPVLNKRQGSRRSCIEIVIPITVRRTKFVPDSESSMSEDSIARQLQSSNRFVSSSKARRTKVIPDSLEASADEGSLSEEPFHHFLGSFQLETPDDRDELAMPRSGNGSDSKQRAKLMCLKRPHGMLQESLLFQDSRKVPRVSIPSSPAPNAQGSRPMHQQRPKRHVNPSTLARKLNDVKKDRISRKPEYFAGDDDDGNSDEGSEIALVAPPPIQSPDKMQRVNSRTIQTAETGASRTPSKAEREQVVISLLTDDEDEDLGATTAGQAGRQSLPASKKYVPVDNGNFAAYAQTSRFMNDEKNRKRVTVR